MAFYCDFITEDIREMREEHVISYTVCMYAWELVHERILETLISSCVGGAVASWLVRSSPDRAVRVRALAGTLGCVLGQDSLLSQCLSPSRSINEYRRIVGENLTNCWGVTCDGLASRPGGVEILLAASCYGNRDKLRPDEPVGSKGFNSL